MSEQSRMVPKRGAGGAALLLAAAWTMAGAEAAQLRDARFEAPDYGFSAGEMRLSRHAVRLRNSARSDFSLVTNYYGSDLTGPSYAGLMTGAGAHEDGQDDYGFGLDYLYGDSVVTLNYFAGNDAEYDEQLFSLGISHELFGGMTTFKMAFGRGDEIVSGYGAATANEGIDRLNYTLGVSQVLSGSLLMNFDYETSMDDGYTGGAYREESMTDLLGPEIYPQTRTSNALSLRALKNWTPSASTLLGYRYVWDSWNVQSHSWEAGYSNQLQNGWLVDLYYRYYTQERASFYGDDFEDELNYVARDRELSAYVSNTLGAKFTYPVFRRNKGITRGTLNLSYEIVDYDYDDYTDSASGSNNPYSLSADSLHLYFSIWY